MLEMTLISEDVNIKQAAIDILTILVEFSPSVIREYILQQSTNSGKICNLLLCSMLEWFIGVWSAFSVFAS